MKHNRILVGFAVFMSIVILSGCTDMKNVTEEQSDMIAEYSAGVLLRYSDKYEHRLITKEQLAKDAQNQNGATAAPGTTTAPQVSTVPETSATPVVAQPEGTATASDSPEPTPQESSLNEIFHVSGIDFTYDSYQFCGKYPKKTTSSQITAPSGETLFVVQFRVRNKTGRTKKVNLMKRGINYTLMLDGSEYQPGICILENGGLNYLNTRLSAGKSEYAVLVFNMSSEHKKASDIKLVLQDGNKSSSIQIK